MQPITNFNQNISQNKCLVTVIATISIALLIISTQNLGHPYFRGIGHIGSYICLGAGSATLLLMVAIVCCKKSSHVEQESAAPLLQAKPSIVDFKAGDINVDKPTKGYYNLSEDRAANVTHVMINGQIFLNEYQRKKKGWLCEKGGIKENGPNDLEIWRDHLTKAKNKGSYKGHFAIPYSIVAKAANISGIQTLEKELTKAQIEAYRDHMHDHETFIYKTKDGREHRIIKSDDPHRKSLACYAPISLEFLALRIKNYGNHSFAD